jgi:hypothetical protein
MKDTDRTLRLMSRLEDWAERTRDDLAPKLIAAVHAED